MGGARRVGGGCGRCGGRVIGAMNVQTRSHHPYTTDEVELLSLIGDLAAGALEKAMLYDGMQRQIAELSTLAEVSETVRQSALLAGCRALDGIAASVIQRPIHLPNPSSFSIPCCSCFASSGFSSAWRSRRTASFQAARGRPAALTLPQPGPQWPPAPHQRGTRGPARGP